MIYLIRSTNSFGRNVKGNMFNLKLIFMYKYLQNKNEVSLCLKDNCILAKGKNADLIAFGVFAILILIGLATLLKAN